MELYVKLYIFNFYFVRGADRCRRAVLLKTASKRVCRSIRSPIVVDRSKTLLGQGVGGSCH